MLLVQGAKDAKKFVEGSPYFKPQRKLVVAKQPFSAQIVEWLTKKNIPTIPVVRLAVDFFGLLYLRDVVARRGDPTEGWDPTAGRQSLFYSDALRSAWYNDVVDTFQETMVFLDEFMFTYLCAATAGELRHAPGKTANKVTKGQLEKWKIALNGSVFERTTTQRNFLNAMVPEKAAEYLNDATHWFGDHSWGGSYGGPKWAAIAKTGYDRIMGQYDATVFVDRVFDLKHNGGPMFDKNSIVEQNKLPSFLDAKLHIKKDTEWHPWVRFGTKRLASLIDKAISVGLWEAKAGAKIVEPTVDVLVPTVGKPVGTDNFDHVAEPVPAAPGANHSFPNPLEGLVCAKGLKHELG